MTNLAEAAPLIFVHQVLAVKGTPVKVSGTSLYSKIKLENKVIVKQVFQVEDLLLTRY